MKRLFCLSSFLIALGSCGPGADTGPIPVAIVGEPDSLFQQGVRLSPAAQHVRAASYEGLVALDPAGDIIPAVAERWIVTDDGRSYIFRLRNSDWPDGEALSADDVRILINDSLARLEGTSLGLDLAKITEVRAMTGRVVELRLSSPMPEFLRLLAQPELGFVKNGSGAGPMVSARDESEPLVLLSALPPESRGLPARENWEAMSRGLSVRALPADAAVAAFGEGEIDLLLNGRLASFPMAKLGPFSRGNVQVDPTLGLFGLVVRNQSGLLGEPARREALSMAIDREALIQPFGLGGWQPTSWLAPPEVFGAQVYPDTRWPELTVEERRVVAARRIAAWGGAKELRVGLPEGPGSDLLFEQLREAWSPLGIAVSRVAPGTGADLELRDRVARYSSPRWFLNQFNCELEIGLCSPEADDLVRESLTITEPIAKEQKLAEAHRALVSAEVFIPLGAPVRWSLVRSTLGGYQANPWGLHPLFPLSEPTT